MKIAIGSDHNGYEFKESIKTYITEELGHEVEDFGCHSCDATDYPSISFKVAEKISSGVYERGILICGTGLGVAIAANKHKGIRAATTHDVYSAERAIASNNAQIITMDAQVIGIELGKKIVNAYLGLTFDESRSGKKVQMIIDKEESLN